jgi:hypothetical protein
MNISYQKLRLLADWVQQVDNIRTDLDGLVRGSEVQDDLREWADALEVSHAVVLAEDLALILRHVEAQYLSEAAVRALDRLGDASVAVRQRAHLRRENQETQPPELGE